VEARVWYWMACWDWFTMSLFIAQLAFPESQLLTVAKGSQGKYSACFAASGFGKLAGVSPRGLPTITIGETKLNL
jgi:Na+/H+ antiporter NhaA